MVYLAVNDGYAASWCYTNACSFCLTLHVRMVIATTGVNAVAITSELCFLGRASEMRKARYSFEKRQREITKRKKIEAARLRKTEKADQGGKEESS